MRKTNSDDIFSSKSFLGDIKAYSGHCQRAPSSRSWGARGRRGAARFDLVLPPRET